MLLKILIAVVLGWIFLQDLYSRSVYWVAFPLLGGLLVALNVLQQGSVLGLWQPALLNIGFLLVQLLLVSAYFSLKTGKLTNVTTGLLGWGDVLFLACLAVYLSVFNFLFFYIGSLMLVILGWGLWQLAGRKKIQEIPLAGLQALIFVFYLVADWWLNLVRLTDDGWLFNLILK